MRSFGIGLVSDSYGLAFMGIPGFGWPAGVPLIGYICEDRPPIPERDRGLFVSPEKEPKGDESMLRLEARHLKKFIGERVLLDIEHLQLHEQDRIGLVGRNGSGKTTLLEILAGKRQADEGTIMRHGTCELIPQLKRTDTTKSGGEVTQEAIQQALVRNAGILLADEPTTNLDLEHVEWVEQNLSRWPGALLVVSHDRAFLDALCTTIWEIHEGKLKVYKGNYTDYVRQKEIERKQRELAYEQYEKKRKQLEEALRQKEQQAARATRVPKHVNPKEAKGAKPHFAKIQKKLYQSAKAMETRLEKLEKVEKEKQLPPIRMNLPNEEAFKGRIILRVEDLSGTIGNRVLWEKARFLVRGGDKLAIIGPNGSGKTTLVKKLVNREPGVAFSPAVQPGYFSQNLNILDANRSILDNVRATSKQDETLIRTVLARLHFFRDDVHKLVGVLSGGERVKVALAKIFLSDSNTLILDEPTNYLDLDAMEALESLLKEYEGTVLFVSHDRRFIESVATRILEIRDGRIELFEGTYAQYQAYKRTVPGQQSRPSGEDERLLIETKLSEVLSRLSIEPSEQLEQEFQRLLAAKRALDQREKG